jgi:hypothetical protein
LKTFVVAFFVTELKPRRASPGLRLPCADRRQA